MYGYRGPIIEMITNHPTDRQQYVVTNDSKQDMKVLKTVFPRHRVSPLTFPYLHY